MVGSFNAMGKGGYQISHVQNLKSCICYIVLEDKYILRRSHNGMCAVLLVKSLGHFSLHYSISSTDLKGTSPCTELACLPVEMSTSL